MEPAPSDANNDSVKLTTKTQNENAIILDAQLTTALITVHIPTPVQLRSQGLLKRESLFRCDADRCSNR